MKAFFKYLFGIGIVLFVLTWVSGARTAFTGYIPSSEVPLAAPLDTDSLHYPIQDRYGDPLSNPDNNSLDLKNPSNISTKVDYNPDENEYDISEKMGTLDYRPPTYMTFDEYIESQYAKSTHDYWLERADEEEKIKKGPLIAPIKVPGKAFKSIFGSDVIDIRPQGSAELIFALNVAKNNNPGLPVSAQTVSTFDFKEKIQMNVTAAIGDKMKLAMNYNTEATFDFENKMKLQYTGHEDEIIKDIEAGNITFPPSGTLIAGSQTLFGIKTKLQFGALMVTSVFSQEKGKTTTINVQGGAQTTNFDFKADQYEANKHYFLAQYFENQYDYALAQTPVIRSNVVISRVEVWVTNKTGVTTNTRNIFAFMDLGEYKFDSTQTLLNNYPPYNEQYPADSSNSLYGFLARGVNGNDTAFRNVFTASSLLAPYGTADNFTSSKNWEKLENARLLQPNEFTFNPLLGYISLNQALNSDEVLGVAFQYSVNGQVFQVGDFSTDGINPPNALWVKMLKSTITNTHLLSWGLMMKNIYALNGYNINPKNFRCDVLYLDDNLGTRINFIPEGCNYVKGIPLIKLLNCDRMNVNRDPFPDGIYDVMDGVTISLANGRIIFPVREPFGSYLLNKFASCNDQADLQLAKKYCFTALYDSTKFEAQQEPQLDKFSLRGTYTGTSNSDISLNAVNVPQGSVTITAGGILLTENVDYTVDYTLGRVKIINQGYLNSNTPLQITLQSNSLFNIQTKTLWGSRFDYTIDKNFTLGATIMHLSELPLTQKVAIGDEPISNTIWGLDGNYRTDSRFITKMIDQVPFLHTKEPSNVTAGWEFADLLPGHAKAIGASGTSYIDDFDGVITSIDIKNPGGWYLASTPQYQSALFPEGNLSDSLPYGYNRALLAWYIVDPLFQSEESGLTPSNITTTQMNNNYVREIPQNEIFPNQSTAIPTAITCLNLAYYPNQRGPYNYDTTRANINFADGTFSNPSARWGGIMRAVQTNDFEAANIDELDFWLMDPFSSDNPEYQDPKNGGDLYFDLGDVSEDILRDSQKSFENGLPAPDNNYTVGQSAWGNFSEITSIVNAFDNDPNSRPFQDIGLDGLSDAQEQQFFSAYLNKMQGIVSSAAFNYINSDPSTDDYHYFQGNSYNSENLPPLQRYKKYNGTEGNSPVPTTVDGYTATATNIPDAEDINHDNNMNETESYFQYHVPLIPSQMIVGQNYIADEITAAVQGVPGKTCKWFEFKIPLRQPQAAINGIQDFKSIRFIRMFMKNWADSVVLRFGQLQFERSNWIIYQQPLPTPSEYIVPQYPGNTTFDETAVSIVENGDRQPINYVLPPGITREVDPTTQTVVQLDEASMSLQVCNLQNGDARAVYKSAQLDLRKYGQLQMYVHAEGAGPYLNKLNTGDLHAFVRLGSDFVDNYYEYEIPLTFTQAGQNDPSQVWPTANNIDINLPLLVTAKEERDRAVANGTWNIVNPYTFTQPGGIIIRVTGTPNLGNVQTIMIGVRNPLKAGGGPSLCAEVWYDELRVTNFNDQGGWATNVHTSAKLADLGTATLAGTFSTPGFGAIDQNIANRSTVQTASYDLSTNLELGKFFPKSFGLRIPFFFGFGETFKTPEYNPLDPDVALTSALDAVSTKQQKDSIKSAALDYTLRKSINFTNVKKNKTGAGKAHFYDVSNFTANFAYTEALHHDVNVAGDLTTSTKGGLAYNYTISPKNVAPFSKSKLLSKNKYLRLIKDFNFYYSPSTVAIRYDLDREYEETRLRNISDLTIPEATTYDKSFYFNRGYTVKYDLTKSLKFDFTSAAQATVDEPQGAIDNSHNRDSVVNNLLNGGRLTSYHQSANLNYVLPLSKIPFTDWISVTAKYGADYGWLAGPLLDTAGDGQLEKSPNRNTINNAQNEAANIQLNFVTLYNKIPYLKKLNSESAATKPKVPVKPVKPPPAFFKPKTAADSLKLKLYKDSLSRAHNLLIPIAATLARLAMSLKSVGLTYTQTNGLSFPGFDATPKNISGGPTFLGNSYENGIPAPGLDFIAGSQNVNLFKQRFNENGWLSTDTNLNAPLIQSHLENYSGRASLEPIKNFKIDLTFNRNYSLNSTEYYKWNDSTRTFVDYSPLESGNFSMSFLSISTAFVKNNSDYSNNTFIQFSSERALISAELAKQNPNSNGLIPGTSFHDGYGADQQDVLTMAFLAAYSGRSPTSVGLNEFPSIPMPNWHVTYDGLSKLAPLSTIFSNINLSTGYRSTYSVGGFSQNLDYSAPNGYLLARDDTGNFIPRYTFQQVIISEQFSPLIGIDTKLKNSMSFLFEVKDDRTVSLSFANAQVTEIRGIEYDVGTGYRFKKFQLPFKVGNKPLRGDLDLKFQFDIRNNYTIIRQLDLNTNQPTAGTEIEAINFSADYIVSPRFTVKLFVITTINTPFVSLTYPTANTNAGFSLRFSLAP